MVSSVESTPVELVVGSFVVVVSPEVEDVVESAEVDDVPGSVAVVSDGAVDVSGFDSVDEAEPVVDGSCGPGQPVEPESSPVCGLT